MNKRPLEKLSYALRRRSQVTDWKTSQRSTEMSQAGGLLTEDISAASSDSFLESTRTASNSSVIHANSSLRQALARGAPETRLTRHARDFIRHSTGKEEAMKAFQALLFADGEDPTPATYKALCSTLLQHHVEQRVGKAAFQKALMDAAGTESDRWGVLSEEERSAFVNYTCRMTERWAERGSCYNEQLGFSQEGADNKIVTHIEYQMRKRGSIMSAASLADLMHLDIAWSTALHLYNYAKELQKVLPSVEMSDRLMGLMTGYKSGLGGSRPWLRALEIYNEVLASGYDTSLTTHTHALDALWRSADTFHRVHCSISSSHQQFVWEKAIQICQNVQDAPQLVVTGEEGCAYAESLVKAFASSGRWSTAVSFLASLDNSTGDVSFRFLVPTPETYAFAIAACNSAGHAAHAEALWTIFRDIYTMQSLHSEALVILLQSFRHVVRTLPIVGSIVEELVSEGKGLERQVVVACLQLLSSKDVTTKERLYVLATKLLNMYDENSWLQQPLARKAELQTVFRCCHLIAAMINTDGKCLISDLRQRLCTIFGNYSSEVEWLDDTSIYGLQTTSSWREALAIYDTTVGRREPERVPYLPIPLRQAKTMLLETLLRCCRAMEEGGDAESFLVDEDTREEGRDALAALTERSLAVAAALFTGDDTFPHHICAELLLLRASCLSEGSWRRALALKAMRHFSQASPTLIDHRHIARLADVLSLTEMHVENALLQGHHSLRYATILFRGEKKSDGVKDAGGGFNNELW